MSIGCKSPLALTTLARSSFLVRLLLLQHGLQFKQLLSLAGLFSGLVSHVVNARFRFPRLVAELTKPAAASTPATAAVAAATAAKATRHTEILPSLGSSGAIYAAVTVTALAFPDAVVSLIFPPTMPIPIQWGVGGMVLLDVVGVLRGWRFVLHYVFNFGSLLIVVPRTGSLTTGLTSVVQPSASRITVTAHSSGTECER
jgi:hypothetical protein